MINGSQTNRQAIVPCDTERQLQDRSRRQLKPIQIRQSQYLNNCIEQDHRAIKRRVRPMLGFQSVVSARVILGGIELIHMMRKQQAKYARNLAPSLAEQFEMLAARAYDGSLAILSSPLQICDASQDLDAKVRIEYAATGLLCTVEAPSPS